MGQINWLISLTLIGLFTVAIMGFAINFAVDNNAPVSISNDPQLSTGYSNIQNNLSTYNSQSQQTYTSILNSTIDTGGQTTQHAGQFGLTTPSLFDATTNILRVGFNKIFGSNSGFGIFLTTFLGIITMISILYIWKTWAGRSPD